MIIDYSVDEWYPVFSIEDEGDGLWDPVDVPDALVARARAAEAEFRACQVELAAALGRERGYW